MARLMTLISFLLLSIEAMAEDIMILYAQAADSTHQITAYTLNGSIIDSACSSTLNSNQFSKLPITVNIMNATSTDATIVVGRSTFPLTDDPKGNKEPSCGLMWTSSLLEVACQVPVPSNFDLTQASDAGSSPCSLYTLLPDTSWMYPTQYPTESLAESNGTSDSVSTRSRLLERRQCATTHSTVRLGNGNPHQNYYHQQTSVSPCPPEQVIKD